MTDYYTKLKNDIYKIVTGQSISGFDRRYMTDLIEEFKIVCKGTDLCATLPKDTCCFVVGDIHGNFASFKMIIRYMMRMMIKFPDRKIVAIFVGDYVDRGSQGLDVLTLVMLLKVCYRNSFLFLRGNHECKEINNVSGFKSECCSKFDDDMYNDVCTIYDYLPITCTIEDRYFIVHGGIPSIPGGLERYSNVKLPYSTKGERTLLEILWCDPECDEKYHETVLRNNTSRNLSYIFGEKVTAAFLAYNNLKMVIRGHEFKPDGYHLSPDSRILTVFSSMNYALDCIKSPPSDISQYLSNSGLVYIDRDYGRVGDVMTDIVAITLENGASWVDVYGKGEAFDAETTPLQFIQAMTRYIHSSIDSAQEKQFSTVFDFGSRDRVVAVGPDMRSVDVITKISQNEDIELIVENSSDEIESDEIVVDGALVSSPSDITKDVTSVVNINHATGDNQALDYDSDNAQTDSDTKQSEEQPEYVSVTKPKEDKMSIDFDEIQQEIYKVLQSDTAPNFNKDFVEDVLDNFMIASEGDDTEVHLPTDARCFVVGDLLGDYESFIMILRYIMHVMYNCSSDTCKSTNIVAVFLGNYVDFGKNGIEILVVIMMLKIKYGPSFVFLRGNHESFDMNWDYGFKDECCTKYDRALFRQICLAYNYLPVSCVLNGRYLMVHSGISPDYDRYKDEAAHSLPVDVTERENVELYRVMWSEPIKDKRYMRFYITDNNMTFGKTFADSFMVHCKTKHMIRSNSIYGTDTWHNTPDGCVTTIFSSMNYLANNKDLEESHKNKTLMPMIMFINNKKETIAGCVTDHVAIVFEKGVKLVDVFTSDGTSSAFEVIQKTNLYMYSGMNGNSDVNKDNADSVDSSGGVKYHIIIDDEVADVKKDESEKARTVE